jgi:hypothetical protein
MAQAQVQDDDDKVYGEDEDLPRRFARLCDDDNIHEADPDAGRQLGPRYRSNNAGDGPSLLPSAEELAERREELKNYLDQCRKELENCLDVFDYLHMASLAADSLWNQTSLQSHADDDCQLLSDEDNVVAAVCTKLLHQSQIDNRDWCVGFAGCRFTEHFFIKKIPFRLNFCSRKMDPNIFEFMKFPLNQKFLLRVSALDERSFEEKPKTKEEADASMASLFDELSLEEKPKKKKKRKKKKKPTKKQAVAVQPPPSYSEAMSAPPCDDLPVGPVNSG